MIEKAKIEALIEKHRLHAPKTPDEVNKLGTGKNAIEKGQEGTGKGKPHIKRQQRISKLKSHTKRELKPQMPKKGKADTLLGDPMANTTTGIEKAKEKGKRINLA